ncbi:DUF1203 domain-containing protein [uncultured Roseobacter sp.]|uniref:DUF1203 domain-containing protein n=1 Tax=uncultured Roseobacter sp. TaxID=114847 RepID=UPI002612B982|nr:DUF1203 domain-containing protein [uncultured Roseobacter sp.]
MPNFIALETDMVRTLQNGGLDVNGQKPQRKTSTGAGNPCRHCLKDVPEGEEILILAHRPFDGVHAYAETGPIFLCAKPCARGGNSADLPTILTTSPDYLVKGYSADEQIVYGTGEVVATEHIQAKVADVFNNPEVAFIHVRSARNNCYQARIDRD